MLRSILLALAAVLVVPAGTATAAGFTHYTAHLEATISYNHVQDASGGNGGTWHFTRHEEEHYTTKLKAVMPMVTFSGGRMQDYGLGAWVETWTTGTRAWREDDSWSGVDEVSCTADGKRYGQGRGGMQPVAAGADLIDLRLTNGFEITGDCDDGRSDGGKIGGLLASDRPLGQGALDKIFAIPAAAVGTGKFAQHLTGGAEGEKCPGHDQDTTSCTVTWNATITFIRDDLAGETDPVDWQHQNAPVPPLPRHEDEEDPKIRAVREAIERDLEQWRRSQEDMIRRVRDAIDEQRIADDIARAWREHSSGKRVDLRCTGCVGSVSAFAAPSATSPGTGSALATARFSAGAKARAAAAAAKRRPVARLRLDRTDLRKLRKAGHVALRFDVRLPGEAKAAKRTITLKLGRKRART